MAGVLTGSLPMKGGEGQYSYTQNSSFQGVEIAKSVIKEAISEKLNVEEVISFSSSFSKLFTIADLGCAVGPNTIIAVENIIDCVKLKYQSYGFDQEDLEFQVFFNDHTSNDFNTLFKSLPSDRKYSAAGVPGRFQGRLFPESSVHFVHSSYALHWLSRVPKEVVDKNSPAWNKGRIDYITAPNEVKEAYSAQFAKDMESFFNARAQELVIGGLMALVIPCLPVGISPQNSDFAYIELLEDSFKEMANMGLISEDKLDSFNCPHYIPTPQEVETSIERNAHFSIERMEPLVRPARHGKASSLNFQTYVSHVRAAWEELIKEHFGNDIIDELFDRFLKKVGESTVFSGSKSNKMVELFVLLKRKVY